MSYNRVFKRCFFCLSWYLFFAVLKGNQEETHTHTRGLTPLAQVSMRSPDPNPSRTYRLEPFRVVGEGVPWVLLMIMFFATPGSHQEKCAGARFSMATLPCL